MWVVNAIIIHILLLGSIFVIYFRSPVIRGLQPQAAPIAAEAPAKRLVLFVTDGLRAATFFQRQCADIPHLRQLLQQHGIVGISRTRVPTESRPGHIALIAGLYEDPSAVTRGWKENPIDFDTVFNRSAHTYAWGANDVLHIFARRTSEQRMFIDAYDHELDFSGSRKTYELDEWVFNKTRFYLKRKQEQLREQQQIVFFLHLLGLDTAGHVHKPDSSLYLENLQHTDKGIVEMYRNFEEIFPDGKTAYILTADHGMTDAGSHGAGSAHETDTPFFFWGAGIRQRAAPQLTPPLPEIEQAQIAPLMSALLGLPPPMNNFGTLPRHMLNTTLEYEAHAAHSNALQLLAQYEQLLRQFEAGYFARQLPAYSLSSAQIARYHRALSAQMAASEYAEALNSSYAAMQRALHGISYYHNYYTRLLLASTTLAMCGWFLYLLQLLQLNDASKQLRPPPHRFNINVLLLLGALFVTFLLLLQRVPFAVSCYVLLPFGVWWLPLQQLKIRLKLQQFSFKFYFVAFFKILLPLLCIELLVLCFFERRLIALLFVAFNLYHKLRVFRKRNFDFYMWCLALLLLALFPLLPPSVGYTNLPLTVLGVALIALRQFLLRPLHSPKMKLFAVLALANALLCMYEHSQQQSISIVSQLISWSFLFVSFAHLLWNNCAQLSQRVELIIFQLCSVYVLLCTSYEPIFVLLLCTEQVLALKQSSSQQSVDEFDIGHCFRLSFSMLLYAFFSFFGTGNIASVSSFDPNVMRCFLSTFAPFVIMALVLLKLIIPLLLVISIMLGLSPQMRLHERRIFISLLLICDVMSLNFLYFVRNEGSWLEIGSSISHFVIMAATTVVLLLLSLVAKLFLRTECKDLDVAHLKTFKGI